MELFGRLLTHGGDAVRAAGRWLLDVLGWLWSLIDTALQPVLSPLLRWLNPWCTRIGDAVYGALAPLPVWAGLTIISVLAGVVMLIAFKFLSNQKAIGRAKDDIKANLLALKLFKDDLGVTFRSQWRLLKAILRLQRYVLTPVLILMPPMLLALAQMGIRYQWRPLHVGEQALVIAAVAPSDDSAPTARNALRAEPGASAYRSDISLSLQNAPGIAVEVDALPGGGKIIWRIRAEEPGRHNLAFVAPDGSNITKDLVVGDGALYRVHPIRPAEAWTQQLLYPAEAPIPAGIGLASLELTYPDRSHWFYGANWWVLSFFVVSMLTAIALKPVFRVRF